VGTNKVQTKELAEQAARWTQALVNALDNAKTDAAELQHMRPDVAPISECVLPIYVLSNVSDSLRVLDVIAEAIRRRAKQSLAKQMMNKAKNEDELTKLRDELKDAYERFMVCHLSKECTPLISRYRSLLRFARRMHFRPFSRPWTLVGSIHHHSFV
jgi:inorganic triphosphatase YgiF